MVKQNELLDDRLEGRKEEGGKKVGRKAGREGEVTFGTCYPKLQHLAY